VSQRAEPPHCFRCAPLRRIRHRHQTRYGPAVPGDDQLLTSLDTIQQFGEMSLGLKGADLGHGK
jgi:hypothetical protein